MHIRFAQANDISAILAISNWAAANTPANFAIEPESLDSWMESWTKTHTMHPWLVAIEGTTVVGFAKASPHRGRCAYAWTAEVSVYVQHDHHGRGIGKALYAQLIPILRDQGYVTLIAGITLPNPASERLHESFGFKPIGVFRRVGWKFDHWHDVGYWEAMLHDAGTPGTIRPVNDAVRLESGIGGSP
jgi:L-amino acid N-acyltransferase YncA